MSNVALVGLLILLPIITGIILYLIRPRALRILIVVLESLFLIALSLILLSKGPIELSLGESGFHIWNWIVVVLDYLLLVYFLYIGIRRKSWLISLLSLAQIGLLAWLEFGLVKEEAVEPLFYIDWLSIIMALVICIVGSMIVLYALNYMPDHEEHLHLEKSRQPRFFLWLVLFLGAMNALVFSNHLIWLYFFWEVTTACCYLLILHDLTDEAINNALRALWMNLIGGLAMVVAMILAYKYTSPQTLALQALAKSGASTALLLPIALLVLGGVIKSAQVPFQSWLLGAMVAPTPVSALLHSSTMVKAGVYLVFRLAPGFQGTALSLVIAVYGAFVLLVTATMALMRTNAKSVLAYSTIGSLGLMIMCAGINSSLAIAAGLALLIFHAMTKGLLFLCVGAIENKIGSRDIEAMEGLMERLPMLTTITLMGALAMLVPPLGVLVSKWLAIEAVPAMSSRWAFIIILLLTLGSSVTIIFWIKWMGRIIALRPMDQRLKIEKLGFFYSFSLLVLLIGIVVLSAFFAPVVDRLVVPYMTQAGYQDVINVVAFNIQVMLGGKVAGEFATWPLALFAFLFLFIPAFIIRVQSERVRPAYMCGENIGNEPRFSSIADTPMEQTFRGFYFGETRSERLVNLSSNLVGLLLLGLAIGLGIVLL